MRKIVIIGAGMMGSALVFPAMENGNEVHLVGTPIGCKNIDVCVETGKHPKLDRPCPKGVFYHQFDNWKSAVTGADFIVCGVSSFGVNWFLDNVLMELDPSVPVLSVTKGLMSLDDGSLISYPEYWKRELSKKGIDREICAVGGPCTSRDLVAGDHTVVAICGHETKVVNMMKEALQTSYYHISVTNDVEGLEIAVAIKNCYALAVAMSIGLQKQDFGQNEISHYNSHAVAFYQALKEMRRILEIHNACEESENIGIADLYLTIYGGRTREAGLLLGEGKSYNEVMDILSGMTLEGFVAVRTLYEAMSRKQDKGLVRLNDFPLLCHLAAVIEEGKDAHLPWENFTFDKANS